MALALLFLCGCTDEGQGTDGTVTSVATNDSPPGHRRMLETLHALAEHSPHVHPYQGDALARRFRRELETLPQNAPNQVRWQLHRLLGVAELKLGREHEGIEHLKRAHELLESVRSLIGGNYAAETTFQLGVAYMRIGETQNCCARFTPESCILPLRGGALHTQQEGSRNAIRYFLEVARDPGAGDTERLGAIWLLNLAHMTLGEYPEEVPESFRIPTQAFETEIEFPRFRNVAQKLGLSTFNLSGGVVIDDLDGDEYLDILTSTWDTSGEMHFFHNKGDGSFADRSKEANLGGIYGGLNMVQSDHDNDGDLDVLVLRGAWAAAEGRHPNSLLENDGKGRFVDVTFDAGLGEVHYPTQTAAWADYDNDGDVDLYIGNETTPELQAPCQLFRNNGDGTFTDVASAAGVVNMNFTKGVTWGDYDGDRYPDIYVSNYNGPNRLYHNNRDGTFTDVAPHLGVMEPIESFPVWFWDFDNDGALDIFASAYTGRIANMVSHQLGLSRRFEKSRLYRGDGHGGFEDVAVERGLDVPLLPMGSNFGDLDDDGWLDFYLGTGDPEYSSVVPNLMFVQREERFVNVTMAGGFGHLQKGHAIAFADLDNDGDLDVFEQMGGAYPGDRFYDALFENPGFGNHSLTVKLVGGRSNRAAIGARLRAQLSDGGRERTVYRHVSSGGSFGANPLRQRIGLGTSRVVDVLEVYWPTTGESQTFRQVPADQLVEIVEGEDTLRRIELERGRF